jgi:catechol 2,3-dioxygenase-like lactoylglutathione lyase family enzyme
MRISAMDHFVLTTQNIEACLRFYMETLGMEKRETNGRLSLWFGVQKINIHTRPAEFLPAAEHPVPGSLDLCFEIEDDIEAVLAELKSKNAPLVTGIVERNGAKGKMRSVYLRDPDGNLIELASYRKMN